MLSVNNKYIVISKVAYVSIEEKSVTLHMDNRELITIAIQWTETGLEAVETVFLAFGIPNFDKWAETAVKSMIAYEDAEIKANPKFRTTKWLKEYLVEGVSE